MNYAIGLNVVALDSELPVSGANRSFNIMIGADY